jgi:cytochrome bd-type quinol oxidase subunit 2
MIGQTGPEAPPARLVSKKVIMKKTLKQMLILMFLLAVLILPYFVFAADVPAPMERLRNLTGAGKSWYQPTDEYEISRFIGIMISAFLGLLGVIFIVLMVFAGYSWMTARGDEQKLDKAKNTIRRAIVGLLIVVGSYAIWKFVFDYLINK